MSTAKCSNILNVYLFRCYVTAQFGHMYGNTIKLYYVFAWVTFSHGVEHTHVMCCATHWHTCAINMRYSIAINLQNMLKSVHNCEANTFNR